MAEQAYVLKLPSPVPRGIRIAGHDTYLAAEQRDLLDEVTIHPELAFIRVFSDQRDYVQFIGLPFSTLYDGPECTTTLLLGQMHPYYKISTFRKDRSDIYGPPENQSGAPSRLLRLLQARPPPPPALLLPSWWWSSCGGNCAPCAT